MENKQIDIKNKLDDGLTFKISRFKEQIKKTKPHKHDEYYELIFLSEGEGFHCIESEKYLITAPEFYFLQPGQLHFWQFTSIPKGFVILFKDDEFDAIKESDLLELYRPLTKVTRIEFKIGQFPRVILNEILNEHIRNSSYSQPIMHGLLKALLGKLLQISEDQPHQLGLPQSTYDKFRQLLVKECPRLHKVNQFSDLLNTTPQNLNAVCRKQTNRSASEIITAQILLEAKRYILHTDNTVYEIAEILSFSDTSNFVKFFRKAEGLTPIQFREKHFQ
jgi:AraC family transcriptional regulator, transcriptional activator of pobA